MMSFFEKKNQNKTPKHLQPNTLLEGLNVVSVMIDRGESD